MYAWGVFILVGGLGSFAYYGLSEAFMRGQTIGKKQLNIRVVKASGFTLDLTSILIRNVFRIADNIPLLWIVPLLSSNSQRLGDMVAGTVVVKDEVEELGLLRQLLLRRSPAEAMYHFDSATLSKARPGDAEAVEKMLERWSEIPQARRAELLRKICGPLAERLGVEPPATQDRRRFLEEFLAAELRRQYRRLD
jgi:hypothetical protein